MRIDLNFDYSKSFSYLLEKSYVLFMFTKDQIPKQNMVDSSSADTVYKAYNTPHYGRHGLLREEGIGENLTVYLTLFQIS